MKALKKWNLFINRDVLSHHDYPKGENLGEVTTPITLELALYQNHILGHPYYSTNNWDYQKYEDYHQYYVSEFDSAKKVQFIRFDGVDTIAEIYVNDVLVGKTDNCYLPFTFKLEGLKKKGNQIVVHIFPNVVEGMKHDFSGYFNLLKYNYPGLYLRRPNSSFGWDILPRTPLGGIYQPVYLLDELPVVSSYQIAPLSVSQEEAVLRFHFEMNSSYDEVKVEGRCGDSYFHSEGRNDFEISIPCPKLWHVRGYGEPYLYEIRFYVIKDNKIIAEETAEYGIRKVELKRSSTVKEGGEFNFYINDEKIFILGSNYVPIEAMKHLDFSRSKKALQMLVDLNCNAIRIWGGGTYESEEFYSLCDHLGIFIWQDFMMACATYPTDEVFHKEIGKEVEEIVKRLRNHASLCLWSGDNENDNAYWYGPKRLDPNTNPITRIWIPELLKKFDPYRPYLPSSPYLDDYAVSHPEEQVAEDHLWGPRDYFKGDYYRKSYPYFTSESGYHGLNSVKSLNRFMAHPWPLLDESGNPTKEYMCHGVSVKDDLSSPYLYRTKLMISQVETLFNKVPDNLEDFSLASQISQAEAMKYFVEKMRRDTKRNGGIIWWNLIDGWPEVSDAIVDYYFDKKLAYYYLKLSQQNLLLFLDEEDGLEKLYVSSLLDTPEEVSYEISDAYTRESLLKGNIHVSPKESRTFLNFPNDQKLHFYIIRFSYGGVTYLNTFHTNIIHIDLEAYKKVLKHYHFFKTL